MTRKFFLGFGFAALFLSSALAQSPSPSPGTTIAPTRVACVGDSITCGVGTQDASTDAYPAQLGTMLGTNWKVKGFGSSGRTLLNSGDYPYQKEKIFQDALAFNPNVVTIMLGTNDTKPQNWKNKNNFVADYKDLIEKFKALPSHPHIYICYPPHVPGVGNYGINEAGVKQEIPMIDQIAADEGVDVIDMHQALIGHDTLLPDRVHPNKDGANLLAKTIYKALIGSDYTAAQ
jgi:lysophospholipase L1-like esterase